MEPRREPEPRWEPGTAAVIRRSMAVDGGRAWVTMMPQSMAVDGGQGWKAVVHIVDGDGLSWECECLMSIRPVG